MTRSSSLNELPLYRLPINTPFFYFCKRCNRQLGSCVNHVLVINFAESRPCVHYRMHVIAFARAVNKREPLKEYHGYVKHGSVPATSIF